MQSPNKLTEAKLAAAYDDAAVVVDELLGTNPQVDESARLDLATVTDFVAHAVVVPFVVSLAGGMTLELIKARKQTARSTEDLEALAREAIGRQIRALPRHERAELEAMAVEDAARAGADEREAAATMEALFTRIAERIRAPD